MRYLIIAAMLSACTPVSHPCQDNPRNMRCMSAGQLERELLKTGL